MAGSPPLKIEFLESESSAWASLFQDETCLLVASTLILLLSMKVAQLSEVPSDSLAEICRQDLGLPGLFQADQPRSSHHPHGLPAEVCAWEPGYPTSVA